MTLNSLLICVNTYWNARCVTPLSKIHALWIVCIHSARSASRIIWRLCRKVAGKDYGHINLLGKTSTDVKRTPYFGPMTTLFVAEARRCSDVAAKIGRKNYVLRQPGRKRTSGQFSYGSCRSSSQRHVRMLCTVDDPCRVGWGPTISFKLILIE